MELVHLALLACRGRQEPSYWLWARSMLGRPPERDKKLGLKLDPFLLRPRVGLLQKGGGPYVLCDMGAQSWPVPTSTYAPFVSSQGARSDCPGSWLLVKGGVQGWKFSQQGEQDREAWLSQQPTV